MMIKRLLYLGFHLFYQVKRWMSLRFTKAGGLVIGGAIFTATFLDTFSTVTYQVFSFLAMLSMFSVLLGIFFQARFTAYRKLPRFSTVGETCTYSLVIRNESHRWMKDIYVSDHFRDPRPDFKVFLQTPEPLEHQRNIFDRAMGYYRWSWLISRNRGPRIEERKLGPIPPYHSLEIRLEAIPEKRGHHHFAEVIFARPDPFGLFRSLKKTPLSDSLIVLPKRYPIPAITLPGSRKYQQGGVALASSVGESDDFFSLREYRPGDSRRRIHWKSWAKTGKPIVKEYHEEFFVRHALILDTFQKEAFSEIFEAAVSIAASFACALETRETLLDLIFVGAKAYCFTSGRGVSQTDHTLEILASVQPCRDKSFSVLPPAVLGKINEMSGCICIFIDWDELRETFVSQLLARGVEPLLILVENPVNPADDAKPIPTHDTFHLHRIRIDRIREGLEAL